MQDLMLGFIDDYGYLGIFLLIFIENVFPPIPSEAVLLFGGALTVTTAMSVPGTIVAATVGSVIGAIVLYVLGRIFQAQRLKKIFAGKVGNKLHLKPEYVDKAERWFTRYQSRAVLLCRCIPIVRSIISIPAGFAKMQLPLFLILTTIGSLVWNTILVSVGAVLGTAWETAMPYLAKYTEAVIVLLLLSCAAFIIWYLRRHKKKNNKDGEV